MTNAGSIPDHVPTLGALIHKCAPDMAEDGIIA
jgi:hypothetical protein